MGVVLVPLIDGKVDACKEWCSDLNGPRNAEITDFNNRYGLTKHESWLTEPPGCPMVIAIHEGPGGADLMPKLGPSQETFDLDFKARLMEFHGMDVTKPPPGLMPEQFYGPGF